MIKYQVRSKDLVDLTNDVKNKRLILSPYFQRNLVWRDLHKRDFIDTILRGYPFPQIFIARGEIDVESMTSQSCVVDGQQRLNAILEFLDNQFPVSGRTFSQMNVEEKEEFLKYQIPVIDLDMKATDPAIVDIFNRLNRTFYALSAIEKMATEYSSIDLMLIAKYLCGNFEKIYDEDEDDLAKDPNLPADFMPWARQFNVDAFASLVTADDIFSGYENTRMVHLMWTLNLVSTVRFGFFPRNDKTKELLDAAEEQVPKRDQILSNCNRIAVLFQTLKLSRTWLTKSNSFSFMVLAFWHIDTLERMDLSQLQKKLEDFAKDLPPDYALAAREGVNNLKERRLRHEWLAKVIGVPLEETPLDG